MSDATRDTLETALQAHIDDVRGGYLVSGYTLTCHLATLEDDKSHYFYIQPARQPYHATLGLMQVSMDDFVNGCDEDDE